MPLKCCVPSCRSNYEQGRNRHVSVFRFPKDPILRSKWLQNIGRKDWLPTRSSVVCMKHFKDFNIIRKEMFVASSGMVQVVPRKIPKLSNDAVPTIFERPVQPCAPQPWDHQVKEEALGDFKTLVTDHEARLGERQPWKVHVSDSGMLFYILEWNLPIPRLKSTVKILTDLSVSVTMDGILQGQSELKGFLGEECKLQSWTQLIGLLNHFRQVGFEDGQWEEWCHDVKSDEVPGVVRAELEKPTTMLERALNGDWQEKLSEDSNFSALVYPLSDHDYNRRNLT